MQGTGLQKGLQREHAAGWAEKVKENLQTFKSERGSMSNHAKIDFIRQQYAALTQIMRALDGKVKFVGAYQTQKGNGNV